MTIPDIVTLRLQGADFEEIIEKITENFDKKTNVKLAIYCAELVLPIFEKEYPNDKRPWEAIQAAKNWLANPTEENRKAANAATVASIHAANAASIHAANAAYATAYAANAAYYAAAYATAYAANAGGKETEKKILDYAIKLMEG